MTMFLLILVLVLAGSNIFTVLQFRRVRGQLELGPTPARKGIEGAKSDINPKHRLKKTFIDRNITREGTKSGQDFYGWNFWCECGTIAPATDNNDSYIYTEKGTEAGAVRAWRKHHDLYAELVDGPSEIEQLKKELKEQRDNCICHDLV